jgi:hypothetical protein
MSHSNTTPNWGIPQFSSNDVPSWLSDVNQIGQKVEQGLNAVKIIGQDANTAASGAQATANALTPRVAQNEADIEGLLTEVATNTTKIEDLENSSANLSNWISKNPIVNTTMTNKPVFTIKYNKMLGLMYINASGKVDKTLDSITINTNDFLIGDLLDLIFAYVTLNSQGEGGYIPVGQCYKGKLDGGNILFTRHINNASTSILGDPYIFLSATIFVPAENWL